MSEKPKFIRVNGRVIPVSGKGSSRRDKKSKNHLDKRADKYEKHGNKKESESKSAGKKAIKKFGAGAVIGATAGALLGKKFGFSKKVGAAIGGLAVGGLASRKDQRRSENAKDESRMYKDSAQELRGYSKMSKIKKVRKKK